MKKTVLTIMIIFVLCAIACVTVVALTRKDSTGNDLTTEHGDESTQNGSDTGDSDISVDDTGNNDGSVDDEDDSRGSDDEVALGDIIMQNAPTTEDTSASASDATTEFPDCYDLELEILLQYPELPAGCESVALTMILNYLGYDLDKTEIVDDYLVYSDNFVMGYCGEPYSYSTGGGIYAPGMTLTANKFFEANGSKHVAENITGTDFDILLEYVAKGYPILIWNTINMADSSKAHYNYDEEGNPYAWDYNEHCVVLTGYDFKASCVTVYDPIEGIIYRDMETFKARYEDMDEMAILIKEVE